jgi:hypothetical protein
MYFLFQLSETISYDVLFPLYGTAVTYSNLADAYPMLFDEK